MIRSKLLPNSPCRPLLAAAAVLGFLFVADLPTAESRTLSNRDLRLLGFAGTYHGFMEGTVTEWDDIDGFYFSTFLSVRRSERVPVRRRSVVEGPTSRNGFFLTYGRARGNDRRVVLRGRYSGFSHNPFYGEEMRGAGVKRLVLVRRGFTLPRYEMRVVDRLVERASYDGALFGKWRMRGTLD